MSWPLVRLVWERYPAGDDKQTLLALADQDRSNDGTSCFPSLATIGFYAGCSASQARRYVRKLERRSVINTLDQDQGGNPNMGRRYIINVDLIASLPKLSDVLHRKRTLATDDRGKEAETPSTDARGSSALPLPFGKPTPSIRDADPYHLAPVTPSTGGSRAFEVQPLPATGEKQPSAPAARSSRSSARYGDGKRKAKTQPDLRTMDYGKTGPV